MFFNSVRLGPFKVRGAGLNMLLRRHAVNSVFNFIGVLNGRLSVSWGLGHRVFGYFYILIISIFKE